MSMHTGTGCRTIEIEGMPQLYTAMNRIYVWSENDIIDRSPIRFQTHIIKKLQDRKIPEVVNLSKDDLNDFVDTMDPQ